MTLNPLDSLLPEPQPSQPIEFRRGTVKALSPLRVHLDRDDPSVWLECSSTIKATVGMRVLVLFFEGRATVLGASHGADAPAPYVPPSPPQWQDWTPTIVSDGTNPTMGNTTRTGRYLLDASGKVDFTCSFVLGSTFTPGSGTYSFPLPVPERSGSAWVVRAHVYAGWVESNSEGLATGVIEGNGTGVTRVRVRLNTTTATRLTILGASVTWASGDTIHISGTYEAS